MYQRKELTQKDLEITNGVGYVKVILVHPEIPNIAFSGTKSILKHNGDKRCIQHEVDSILSTLFDHYLSEKLRIENPEEFNKRLDEFTKGIL